MSLEYSPDYEKANSKKIFDGKELEMDTFNIHYEHTQEHINKPLTKG